MQAAVPLQPAPPAVLPRRPYRANYALTRDQLRVLAGILPEIDYDPYPNATPHTHGVLALCRRFAEADVYDQLQRRHPGIVFDVGGNPLRHARRQVFSANPILDARDHRREAMRQAAHAVGWYCNERAQVCVHAPACTTAMFIHSAYYMTEAEIAVVVARVQAHYAIIVTHEFPDAHGGIAGEAQYRRHGPDVIMHVTGAESYRHSACDWLTRGGSQAARLLATRLRTTPAYAVFEITPVPDGLPIPIVEAISFEAALAHRSHYGELNVLPQTVTKALWARFGEATVPRAYSIGPILWVGAGTRSVLIPKGAIHAVATRYAGSERTHLGLRNAFTIAQRVCAGYQIPPEMLNDTVAVVATLAYVDGLESETALAEQHVWPAFQHPWWDPFGALTTTPIERHRAAMTPAAMPRSWLKWLGALALALAAYRAWRAYRPPALPSLYTDAYAPVVLPGTPSGIGIKTGVWRPLTWLAGLGSRLVAWMLHRYRMWRNVNYQNEFDVASATGLPANVPPGAHAGHLTVHSLNSQSEKKAIGAHIVTRQGVTTSTPIGTIQEGPSIHRTPAAYPTTSAALADCAPTRFAANSHNENVALHNRVMLTRTVDADQVDVIADFYRAAGAAVFGKPVRFDLSITFEEWAQTQDPDVREVLYRAKQRMVALPMTPKDLELMFRHKSFVKTELANTSADGYYVEADPRLIQAGTPELNACLGPYVWGADKLANAMLIGAPWRITSGMYADELGQPVALLCNAFDVVGIEIDRSRWDSCIGPELQRLELQLYSHTLDPACPTFCGLTIRQLWERNMATKGHTYGGTKYTVEGTRHSGDPQTSGGNSRLNMAFSVYAFLHMHSITTGRAHPLDTIPELVRFVYTALTADTSDMLDDPGDVAEAKAIADLMLPTKPLFETYGRVARTSVLKITLQMLAFLRFAEAHRQSSERAIAASPQPYLASRLPADTSPLQMGNYIAGAVDGMLRAWQAGEPCPYGRAPTTREAILAVIERNVFLGYYAGDDNASLVARRYGETYAAAVQRVDAWAGLRTKLILRPNPMAMEFCSSIFWAVQDELGLYTCVLGPKPGRMLAKAGALGKPVDDSRAPSYSRGVALGVLANAAFVPFVRQWADAIIRVTKGVEAVIHPEAYHKFSLSPGRAYYCTDVTILQMVERYGPAATDTLLQWNRTLGDITALPVVLMVPGIADIVRIDNGQMPEHGGSGETADKPIATPDLGDPLPRREEQRPSTKVPERPPRPSDHGDDKTAVDGKIGDPNRRRRPDEKRPICANYRNFKQCRYEEKCRFIHDEGPKIPFPEKKRVHFGPEVKPGTLWAELKLVHHALANHEQAGQDVLNALVVAPMCEEMARAAGMRWLIGPLEFAVRAVRNGPEWSDVPAVFMHLLCDLLTPRSQRAPIVMLALLVRIYVHATFNMFALTSQHAVRANSSFTQRVLAQAHARSVAECDTDTFVKVKALLLDPVTSAALARQVAMSPTSSVDPTTPTGQTLIGLLGAGNSKGDGPDGDGSSPPPDWQALEQNTLNTPDTTPPTGLAAAAVDAVVYAAETALGLDIADTLFHELPLALRQKYLDEYSGDIEAIERRLAAESLREKSRKKKEETRAAKAAAEKQPLMPPKRTKKNKGTKKGRRGRARTRKAKASAGTARRRVGTAKHRQGPGRSQGQPYLQHINKQRFEVRHYGDYVEISGSEPLGPLRVENSADTGTDVLAAGFNGSIQLNPRLLPADGRLSVYAGMYEKFMFSSQTCVHYQRASATSAIGSMVMGWDPDPQDRFPADGQERLKFIYSRKKHCIFSPWDEPQRCRVNVPERLPHQPEYYIDNGDSSDADLRQTVQATFRAIVDNPFGANATTTISGSFWLHYVVRLYQAKFDVTTFSLPRAGAYAIACNKGDEAKYGVQWNETSFTVEDDYWPGRTTWKMGFNGTGISSAYPYGWFFPIGQQMFKGKGSSLAVEVIVYVDGAGYDYKAATTKAPTLDIDTYWTMDTGHVWAGNAIDNTTIQMSPAANDTTTGAQSTSVAVCAFFATVTNTSGTEYGTGLRVYNAAGATSLDFVTIFINEIPKTPVARYGARLDQLRLRAAKLDRDIDAARAELKREVHPAHDQGDRKSAKAGTVAPSFSHMTPVADDAHAFVDTLRSMTRSEQAAALNTRFPLLEEAKRAYDAAAAAAEADTVIVDTTTMRVREAPRAAVSASTAPARATSLK